MPERSKGVDSSSTMFACAGSNPADGTLMVGVVNTLRARGHWFDSFIGDAPLISTVEARSPICRDVGIQSSTINLRNEVKLFFSPSFPSPVNGDGLKHRCASFSGSNPLDGTIFLALYARGIAGGHMNHCLHRFDSYWSFMSLFV